MDALGMATYQECSLNLSGLLGLQTTGDYHVLTLGIPLAVCAVISLGYLLLEQKKKGRGLLYRISVPPRSLSHLYDVGTFPGMAYDETPVSPSIAVQYTVRMAPAGTGQPALCHQRQYLLFPLPFFKKLAETSFCCSHPAFLSPRLPFSGRGFCLLF